jgi:hypothetical protein
MKLWKTLVAVAMGVASTNAFGQATVDRHVDQIAVVAKAGDPAGTYRVSVAWGIDVTTSATLPIGSVLSLSKNGTSVWTSTLPGSAFVGGSCPECAPGTLCVCVSGGDCTCAPCAAGGTGTCSADHLSTIEVPGAIPLAVGDVLTFSVAAVTGSTIDQFTANNVKTMTFNGTQTFWNRRLVSAELVPSSCPGAKDTYDLHYTIAYDFSGLAGELDLSASFELLHGGVAVAAFDACHDDPWITTGVSCGGATCGTSGCGFGSCAGANADLDCQQVEMPNGLTSCVCSSGQLSYLVEGITIPGLEGTGFMQLIAVAQIGGHGLVEIPTLAGDNAFATPYTAAPRACDADINKDGKIDAADLALLLGAWGECQ